MGKAKQLGPFKQQQVESQDLVGKDYVRAVDVKGSSYVAEAQWIPSIRVVTKAGNTRGRVWVHQKKALAYKANPEAYKRGLWALLGTSAMPTDPNPAAPATVRAEAVPTKREQPVLKSGGVTPPWATPQERMLQVQEQMLVVQVRMLQVLEVMGELTEISRRLLAVWEKK